ncbi:hypothetical protein AVEN_142967-1, partial [Araneus ventricosus]
MESEMVTFFAIWDEEYVVRLRNGGFQDLNPIPLKIKWSNGMVHEKNCRHGPNALRLM